MQTIHANQKREIERRNAFVDDPIKIAKYVIKEDIRIYLSWTYRSNDAEIVVEIRDFYIYLFDNVLHEYEHIKYDEDGDPIPYFRVDTWDEWEALTNKFVKEKHLTNYLISIFPNYKFITK